MKSSYKKSDSEKKISSNVTKKKSSNILRKKENKRSASIMTKRIHSMLKDVIIPLCSDLDKLPKKTSFQFNG
jgi:hypothetical protein